MQCPDCGGPCWDNRQSKRNPKQPDYKCKDKDCGKGVREDKPKGGAGSPAAAKGSRPLGALYFQCMKVAQATVMAHLGDKATPADVIAACATIFIAAANTGAPVIIKKEAPKAPPPPPEPEPEESYESDEDLPF